MYMAPIFRMRGSFPKLMQMFQKSIQIKYLILKNGKELFSVMNSVMAFGKKKVEHRSPRPDHCSALKKIYVHVQNLLGESPLLSPLSSPSLLSSP